MQLLKKFKQLFKKLKQLWLKGTSVTVFSYGATAPSGPGAPHFRGLTITLSYTSHLVGVL
jgi:hypothetical protein